MASYRETSERKVQAMGGRFGYGWITFAFFLLSLAGHWPFIGSVSSASRHNTGSRSTSPPISFR
jgi:hypothetical protein